MKQLRITYSIMAAGGAIGIIAAFLQTTEKLVILGNKNADLVCNLNSVFSCTNVLNAWQSSVFGFPNSLMCMILFTIFTTIALVGVTDGHIGRGIRLSAQALSLFTLGFAVWFLTQSIYVINALCILCIFCFAGLLLVNWGWLRLNVADLPIGERGRSSLTRMFTSGADIFVWCLVAVALGFAMLQHFSN